MSFGVTLDTQGGWGRLTMGLVNIVASHGKSYGVLGT
jgi:hypothetical protein